MVSAVTAAAADDEDDDPAAAVAGPARLAGLACPPAAGDDLVPRRGLRDPNLDPTGIHPHHDDDHLRLHPRGDGAPTDDGCAASRGGRRVVVRVVRHHRLRRP